MTIEETRNSRGQLLVMYPAWLDISTVAERAGVSRYHGYLIIKDTPSCQRVEFKNHPNPNQRIDLAANSLDAEAAISAYKAKQREKLEREETQKQLRAESRKALPEKRRQIGDARELRNNAKRDLSRLKAGIKNETSKRRGARRSQHNNDLQDAVTSMNVNRDNAQQSFQEQGAQLAKFHEEEIATIMAEYERMIEELDAVLEVDIEEMDDEVEAENIKEIEALEAVIEEQQAKIDRLSRS